MHSYEIEIKSLLGGKDKADELKNKMKAADPEFAALGSHSQLNHYFVPTTGLLKNLYDAVKDFLPADQKLKLRDLAARAKDFSVRTREADGKVLLVVKASVDDTTSENGIARLEFESQISSPLSLGKGRGEGLSLNDLDKLILGAGFAYQAKWSRQREEFKYKGVNVSIDKNAGYGYLSEFERVVDDPNKADETKSLIRSMMKDLGVEELSQDRLGRMFDYYNKNWPDYYGTEKIFNIE